MPGRIEVEPGTKYGRWTVLSEANPRISNKGEKFRRILCKCECGTVRATQLTHLRQGVSKSCGCLARELFIQRNIKYGTYKTPLHALYRTWGDMIRRCTNPNHARFKDWDGRGIKVCEEWLNDFNVFKDWALRNGWRKGLLIERKDNNRTNNHWITYKGETKTLTQWARHYGFKPSVIYGRIHAGWSFERAISTPVDKERSKNTRKQNARN